MKNNVNSVKKSVKKKKSKMIFFSFLFVIFAIGLIVSLLEIFFWNNDNNNVLKISEDISKNTEVKTVDDDKNTEVIEDKSLKNDKNNSYWQFIKMPLIDVDIDSLIKQNSDTVGWININNTNINYPFVQAKDNKYYLTRAFDKSSNEAGWLFLDYRNSKDFSNKNNIIYGHSRLNKTMFGSLHNVLSSNWYNNKNNHIIRLSTQTENTMWQIFSVYKVPVETYYLTTDFDNSSSYSKFLKTIKGRSVHSFDVNVSSSDKILTLSTCSNNNKRVVVHAKLIKRSSK